MFLSVLIWWCDRNTWVWWNTVKYSYSVTNKSWKLLETKLVDRNHINSRVYSVFLSSSIILLAQISWRSDTGGIVVRASCTVPNDVPGSRLCQILSIFTFIKYKSICNIEPLVILLVLGYKANLDENLIEVMLHLYTRFRTFQK